MSVRFNLAQPMELYESSTVKIDMGMFEPLLLHELAQTWVRNDDAVRNSWTASCSCDAVPGTRETLSERSSIRRVYSHCRRLHPFGCCMRKRNGLSIEVRDQTVDCAGQACSHFKSSLTPLNGGCRSSLAPVSARYSKSTNRSDLSQWAFGFMAFSMSG